MDAVPPPPISILPFRGRRTEDAAALARLGALEQAALGQFSQDRLVAYGLTQADATELRAAVIDGAAWQQAADALAQTALDHATEAAPPTRIALLRRASALLRMSQMMMPSDSNERRVIFARAAALYEEAASHTADRQHVRIATEAGMLVGWLHPATQATIGSAPIASAIVIGGVEGWAMDFATLGESLAARGIDALMLDGPGQGESRFAHQHYLSPNWRVAYRGAIDFLARRAPDHRIGIVGNSMGGSIAMALAAADPRIAACCTNCGVAQPAPERGKVGFSAKLLSACNLTDPADLRAIWESIDPITPVHGLDYSLLIVHGGADPFLPNEAAAALLARAPTNDKRMVIFADGDHCIYNHREDRDALIADWLRARLAA